MEGINIRSKQTRINQQIRVPRVRLIDQDGNQQGIVETTHALSAAMDAGLDLVEISPNADPPVCRIMDHGKYLFEQNKRKAAAKKKQKVVTVKVVQMSPRIGSEDYRRKLDNVSTFLERGHKVRVVLRFRGREMQHRDIGLDLLNRVRTALDDVAMVEQQPKLEGRQITMVVAPAVSKA